MPTRTATPDAPDAPVRRRRNARRKQTVNKQLRRFDSALPRFWLKPLLPTVDSRPLPRFTLPRIHIPWGWLLALLIVGGVGYGIYWTQSDARWFVYREHVQFENLGYLDAEELYALSEIDAWNVFWLRSEAIRTQLLRHPFVVDAQVKISLPNQVTIRVAAAQPVALWVTGKGRHLLMPNGYARPLEGDENLALPQLIDRLSKATAPGASEGTQIQQSVLNTALALIQRMPTLGSIRYDQDIGISFQLIDSDLFVYWGDDRNFETKLQNMQAAQKLVTSGQAVGTVIDVRTPERPFVK